MVRALGHGRGDFFANSLLFKIVSPQAAQLSIHFFWKSVVLHLLKERTTEWQSERKKEKMSEKSPAPDGTRTHDLRI